MSGSAGSISEANEHTYELDGVCRWNLNMISGVINSYHFYSIYYILFYDNLNNVLKVEYLLNVSLLTLDTFSQSFET